MRNYKGVAYPIEKNSQGFFHGGDDVAQIKASFLTIIMTKPGERVFSPSFGCPLHTLNLAQPAPLLEEQARQMIARSLSMWEKRFPVTGLATQVVEQDLKITVNFVDPANLQQEHTLTLQLPL